MQPETPPPTSPPVGRDKMLKAVYWVAAAAMAAATVLAAMQQPVDWMAIAGRGSLIAALVLLATAKPVETRGKKIVIYGLVAVALGLLLARFMK